VKGTLPRGIHTIKAVASANGRSYQSGYIPIEYPHINPQRIYRPSTISVNAVDVTLPARLNVAYVPGVGDNVAPVLEQLGVPLEDALGAEVADVVLLPALTENVVFAIRKATHAPRRAAASGKREGRIITVFSPKGGTGKTAIATNLAAALAKGGQRRTLLLDLDLQFGDAAIMLGIEPEKTIFDFVNAPGELDPDKLAGYTTTHKSGLDILPAPLRPEDAELVTEAKLGRLLEVAKACYDAIIVDTSPFFHGPMLATLDRTDELLLVCSLDVPTLKNVRLALGTLDMLSFPPARIRIVLNRANTKVGMKQREVEAALEQKVTYEIPSDRAVPLCINKGAPAVLAEPGSDFARSIETMAKGVFPTEETKRRGLRLRPNVAKAAAA